MLIEISGNLDDQIGVSFERQFTQGKSPGQIAGLNATSTRFEKGTSALHLSIVIVSGGSAGRPWPICLVYGSGHTQCVIQIVGRLVAPLKETHNQGGGVLPVRDGLDLMLLAKVVQHLRQHRELLGICLTG